MSSRRYREYLPALLLAAGCAVLAVVVAAEWALLGSQPAPIGDRPATPAAIQGTAATASDEDEAPFELPELDNYSETIARPLFQETRKPGDNADEEPAAAPAAQTPLNLKLMGVIMTPQGKIALLVDAQNKYKRARRNTVVGSWKVIEIEANKVVMEQGTERKDLQLLKPKPKSPQAAQTTVPPQPPQPPHVMVKGPQGRPIAPIPAPVDNDEADITDDETVDESEDGADDTTADETE